MFCDIDFDKLMAQNSDFPACLMTELFPI